MTQAHPNSRPPPDATINAAIDHLRDFPLGRVLPTCSSRSNGKLPMLRGGCRSSTGHIGEVPGLFGQSDAYGLGLSATGYAFYPAPDIVVIDVDRKNGKDGLADIARLEALYGKLPSTATVLSPSGGVHLYLQLPPGAVLPHILIGKLAPGLDIFAYHETKSLWVAGPGTVTPKGAYRWKDDAAVAMLPAAWIKAIQDAKPPRKERDPSQPLSEREPVTLGYVTEALAVIDPDGLGHDLRFTVRAVIMEASVLDAAGKEVPDEDKIELLRAWCGRNPRFDDDAFDRSINSILDSLDDDAIDRAGVGSLHKLAKENGYAGAPPSALVRLAEAASMLTDHTASNTNGAMPAEDAWPTVYTAADICNTEAPPRQWVWGDDDTGMIPLGETTLVVGPEGSGKSLWGGVQFGRDASRGVLSCGLPTRKMPVLSVNAEDPIEEIHRRAKKQGVRPSDDIRFVSFAGHDATLHPPFPRFGAAPVGEDTTFHKFLDHHLGEMGTGEKLLLLDNVGQLYQDDDTDKAKVRAFYRIIERLRKKHNATVVLFAHPSGAQRTSGEGSFGSVAWSALVRSRLYFDYVRDGKGKQISETRILSRKKSNYSKKDADGQGIFLAWQDWNFVRVAAPELEASPGNKSEEMAEKGRLLEIGRAIKEVLKSFGAGHLSDVRLAHHLQGKVMDPATGKKYSVMTLRRDVKKVSEDLDAYGCTGLFDPDAKPHIGRWHYPDEMRAAEAKPSPASARRSANRSDRAERTNDTSKKACKRPPALPPRNATVSLADAIQGTIH